MAEQHKYIVCYGSHTVDEARGLAGVLRRLVGAAPTFVLRPVLHVGADQPPPPPDEVLFSYCLYKARDAQTAAKLCELLNQKYGYVEANVHFCDGWGLNEKLIPLYDEQVQTIATYGQMLNDPVRAAMLLPGVRRLAEYWLTAHRFENSISGVPTETPVPAKSSGDAASWLKPVEAMSMLKLGDKTDRERRHIFDKLRRALPEEHRRKKGRVEEVEINAWRRICDLLQTQSGMVDDWSTGVDDVVGIEARKAAERRRKQAG